MKAHCYKRCLHRSLDCKRIAYTQKDIRKYAMMLSEYEPIDFVIHIAAAINECFSSILSSSHHIIFRYHMNKSKTLKPPWNQTNQKMHKKLERNLCSSKTCVLLDSRVACIFVSLQTSGNNHIPCYLELAKNKSKKT